MNHTPNLPLCFIKPIMTHAHAPIHSPHKWLKYNIHVWYYIIFITYTPTHPYPNYSSKIFVPSLLNNSSCRPRQKNTALILIWSITLQIYLWLQKHTLYVTYYMTPISNLYKPRLPHYKNPCVLFELFSTIHTPTIQHTRLPPITHYMLIIIIHTYTCHPIKTHHNSQTSKYNHIFITPSLSGSNQNIKYLPLQHGVSQGRGNMILTRSQDVLPSSRFQTPLPWSFHLSW